VTSKPAGRKAGCLFGLLILTLLSINGLNVLISYVGRDFMTAIEDRNRGEFVRMALIYVGVFGLATVISTLHSYIEEYLGLLWREWATGQSIVRYATHRVYYRLKKNAEVGNPDQRITEDIRFFGNNTLSFLLMILNGSLTVVAFSGVLWSISPRLFVVAVLYASAGTFLTFLFGRPLIRLNYDQLDKEANLRASLIHLREHAESIALSRHEGRMIKLSLRNLSDLTANFRRIISVNRNLKFFSTGYNWMIQIIPALIVAPLFLEGHVGFGVITQSAIAFTHLSGAFSLIVTQFQSISSYTAVLARLSLLGEAGERERRAESSQDSSSRDDGRIAYRGLTLRSQDCGRVLVRELSLEIRHGRRVLIQGPDETARSALFQATAGLWLSSEGHVVRPSLDRILLLPEIPYLPPGTMRELLVNPWPGEEFGTDEALQSLHVSDEQMAKTFRMLKIDSLLSRFEPDKPHQWDCILPLDKQQLLSVARALMARPRFVLLESPGSTLRPDQIEVVLQLLRKKGISCVTFEGSVHEAGLRHYDALLELEGDGAWTCRPIKGGTVVDDQEFPLAAA
jgi:putative ATP-binding cassette transporter